MHISRQRIILITLFAIILYTMPFFLIHDFENLASSMADYVNDILIIILIACLIIGLKYRNKLIVIGSALFLLVNTVYVLIRHNIIAYFVFKDMFTTSLLLIPLLLLSTVLLSLGILQAIERSFRKNTLNALFHQTNKAIHFEYNYDKNIVTLECTDAFCDSYQLTNKKRTMTIEEFFSYVHKDDQKEIAYFKDPAYHQIAMESYYRLKLPSMQSYTWIHSESIPSKMKQFISIETDFSETHKMITLMNEKDQVIKHSKADLNFIMDHSSDFIVKYDKNGQLDYVSDSFLTFFEIEEKDVLGKTYQELDKMFEVEEDTWFTEALDKRTTTDVVKSEFKGKTYWISWHNHTITNDENDFEFMISIGTNLTEMMKMNERLDYDSKHDQLTKLLNRRGLYTYINDMYNQEYTLFFIDIHHFMTVNDYYGSEIGDKMIVKVANTLEKLDPQLLVARYEGDEFILIANKKVNLNRLIQKLEKIKQKVYHHDNIRTPIHLNIGYAKKTNNESLASMITNASLAMAHSRQLTTLSIVEFAPAMRLQLKEKLTIVEKLKQAITDDQLMIHFQAIFNGENEKVMLESLARWYDKDIGYISPSAFFQVAKEASLIFDLDYFLITKSIRTFKSFLDESKDKELICSINFTMETLFQEGIIKRIANYAKSQGLIPSQICVEITESTFVKNVDFLLRQIKTMKQYGFLIAIDDFGKEYSSLSLIKSLDVDIIKIDKQFIHDLSDEHNQVIIKMVLEIADIQQAKVIVEGIEMQSQFTQLKTIGCDYFQGFYLEKPYDYLDKEKR